MEGGEVVGQTRAAWKAVSAQPALDLATEVVSEGPRTAIVTGRWTQAGVARRDYALWARLECAGASSAGWSVPIVLGRRRMLALLWVRQD